MYYGSTINQNLRYRLSSHVTCFKRWQLEQQDLAKGYCESVHVLGHEDTQIELVEDFPCMNRDQLRAREQFYIENNECVNKRRAFGVCLESVAEYKRLYNINNREHLAALNKQCRSTEKYKAARAAQLSIMVECSCGIMVKRADLRRHEKSQKHLDPEGSMPMTKEEATEKGRARCRDYYSRNKDKLNRVKSTPFTCECGGAYRKKHYSTHCATKKHTDYTSSLIEPEREC